MVNGITIGVSVGNCLKTKGCRTTPENPRDGFTVKEAKRIINIRLVVGGK